MLWAGGTCPTAGPPRGPLKGAVSHPNTGMTRETVRFVLMCPLLGSAPRCALSGRCCQQVLPAGGPQVGQGHAQPGPCGADLSPPGCSPTQSPGRRVLLPLRGLSWPGVPFHRLPRNWNIWGTRLHAVSPQGRSAGGLRSPSRSLRTDEMGLWQVQVQVPPAPQDTGRQVPPRGKCPGLRSPGCWLCGSLERPPPSPATVTLK